MDTYRVRELEFNPIIEPQKRKGYTFEKSIDWDFFEAIDEEFENDNTNVASSSTAAAVTADPASRSRTVNRNRRGQQNKRGKKLKYKAPLSSSVWNCDGEIVQTPAVHVKMHCQLLKIFAPGFDVEKFIGNNNKVSGPINNK